MSGWWHATQLQLENCFVAVVYITRGQFSWYKKLIQQLLAHTYHQEHIKPGQCIHGRPFDLYMKTTYVCIRTNYLYTRMYIYMKEARIVWLNHVLGNLVRVFEQTHNIVHIHVCFFVHPLTYISNTSMLFCYTLHCCTLLHAVFLHSMTGWLFWGVCFPLAWI